MGIQNISWDGSPVRFQIDSPWLLSMDSLALDWTRQQLGLLDALDRNNVQRVLAMVNANQPTMGCHEIKAFHPGPHLLDPRDIQKFGDEEGDLDWDGDEDECSPALDDQAGDEKYPFVNVDSGAIVFVDISHLAEVVELLTWEQYDLGLQDDRVFAKIVDALGGPCFALILAAGLPGHEFDGDGTYTIKPGAVRPCRP